MAIKVTTKTNPTGLIAKMKRFKIAMSSKYILAVHRKIAIMLFKWVMDNFKTEGGKVGKWRKLALGGRWVKGKGLDRSAKILQDTGRLRASFVPFENKKTAGIRNSVPYAATHEKGQGRIPARRMLPIAKEVSTEAEKIADYEFKRMKKEHGIN